MDDEREPIDNLGDLNKRLHSREEEDFTLRRSRLNPRFKSEQTSWGEKPAPIAPTKPATPILYKALAASVAFFVVVAAVAAYILFSGASIISNRNIEAIVKGPLYVKAGDQIDLQILLANKNKENIGAVNMKVDFPAGTRSSTDIKQDMTHSSVFFGDIRTGETVNKSIKAYVFGQQNSEQEIKLTLEYNIPGSNAIFRKQLSYKYQINASPVNVTLNMPAEVNTNQDLTLNINAVSNSPAILKNMLLVVNYPPGFQFKDSNLKPSFDNNKWILGDMAAGDGKDLIIHGVLAGQTEDIKSFEVLTGVQDEVNRDKISVIYNDTFRTLAVRRAFLGIAAVIGGRDADQYVISGQDPLEVAINWVNNLQEKVTNASVEVSVDGNAVDRSSINLSQGFYRSQDSKIILSANDDPGLASLDAGQKGELTFNFGALPLASDDGKTFRNPNIKITATISGTRASSDGLNEKIHNEITKVIKIQSPVKLQAASSYSSGPLQNRGPLPPVVDKETTYTVTWSLVNPSNDLKSVRVRANLPTNVAWLKSFSPASEDLEFDLVNKEVTWKVDNVPGGTGVTGPAKMVSFQLGLTPSLSQLGQRANLLSQSQMTALDTFTNTTVSQTAPALSTLLNNDDMAGLGSDLVTQ